jgi:hypothetical protein
MSSCTSSKHGSGVHDHLPDSERSKMISLFWTLDFFEKKRKKKEKKERKKLPVGQNQNS